MGTSNPVLDLHIVTGNTPALRLEQDGSSGFTAQTWDVAANETNFFIRDATNGSALPLRIRPGAPSNSLFVKEGGNIGMGTSSPISDGGGRELTITSSSGNFSSLNLQGTRTADGPLGTLRFYNGGSLVGQIAGVREGTDDTASMRFLTTSAGAIGERMRITPTGNVGVGIAAPNIFGGAAKALAVSSGGPGFAALELQGTQTADAPLTAMRFYNGTNLVGQVSSVREGADNSGSMRFFTSNVGSIGERMRINPWGLVGIGTTTPTDTLHVVGSARVTGNLHVSGSIGPDYVFDPNFKLASIEENAAFMWKNRHLPALGPARTSEDGKGTINVYSHVNGMLEELEKAHIYIEKLHNEIKTLKAEAAAKDAEIRAELAALRVRIGK